ncbi:hypothetical protein AB0D99_31895 [Streptomyces sp. NPDC047971]|uniref:hypothetical protein n=1 Tax=Streptomyces sp. NPDC047971 TaxID=3154499 RepID=UPI0033FB5ECB
MPVPDARVEAKVGGTWTDITNNTFSGPGIQLSWGRTDEGRTVDPGSGALVLKSPDGLFSNRNPNSPYYGLLGRNTPIRVSTTAGETVLDIPHDIAGRASTPDHASLDITGDIDVRADVSPSLWGGSAIGYELMGKYVVTGGQLAWLLMITGEGEILFTWSPNGTDLIQHRSAVLPFVPMHRAAVRATLDVNNGLGGYTLTYYTAPTLAGPWTQLSQTVTTSGTTSIFNSSAPLEVGDVAVLGFTRTARRIHAAEVRNGIGGSVVAAPDFSAQAAGTTSFADSAGRTWTVANATITDRRVRRLHSVPHWPARWHTSGHDQRAPIQTAGVLRRLGQGKKPLASALARRVPVFSPQAYWPFEDSAGATDAASPILGVTPMRCTGFTFGQDDTLNGSAALPTVDPGGKMRGQVPAPASSTGQWNLCLIYRVDGAAPGSEQELLGWQTTGTVRRWRITSGASSSSILGYDVLGALVVNHPVGTGTNLFTGWRRLEFTAVQNGGNIDWDILWTAVGGNTSSVGASVAGTLGNVSLIDTTFGAGLPDIRVGHLGVFSALSVTAAYASADHGYTGETASARLARLANEESATVRVAVSEGDPTSPTEAMGPQRPKALLDLLQDCADTDGGILYEDSQALALIYRDRVTLENQVPALVLDYSAGDVASPFEPTESDLQLVNDVTVNREGGSFGRAVEEDGPLGVDAVGLYDTSITLSLANDTQAERIAGWRLHLGAWDEARFPTVRIMLHHRPDLIPAVTALQIGDRIQVVNTPSWMPPGPVDLLVQRIDDDIRTHTWVVTLTCSPAGPWNVGVVDDAELGRVDTDGSELAAAVSSSATSFTVQTTAGAAWTLDPADCPFDVALGGEEVTVTAVTSGAVDDFSAAVSNGWGTADVGGPWTFHGGTAADYNVTGGRGTHTLATVGTSRRTTLAWTVPDVDVQVDIQTSVLATGASLTAGLMARHAGVDDLYTARLEFTTAQAVILSIRSRVGGVETQLGTFTTGLTHAASTDVRLRFQVFGDELAAKVWSPTLSEPVWQVQATDTGITTANPVGCRSLSLAGNTNVNPVIRYDGFVIHNPQLMTVTRSANGIVKGHSAGADLRLATPTIVAL